LPVIGILDAMRLPVDKDLHCLQYPGSYTIGFAQVESNDSNKWPRFDDGMTTYNG